jgi:hypothetical protein
MSKKLLALYGLKYNPFCQEVPVSALFSSSAIEHFCWRIEHQLGEGGFARVTGAAGAGKSASKEVAPLLGYLRELQREFGTAVLLVHHARKGSGKGRPGQALRGSSDLHGWGDSNLYPRRKAQGLSLSIEQRAAPSRGHVPLKLVETPGALALHVVDEPAEVELEPTSACERVIEALTLSGQPLSTQQPRKQCRIRTATLRETLAMLGRQSRVTHGPQGYTIAAKIPPFPVSFPVAPIDPSGNGNGKRPQHAQLPLTLDHQLASR